MHFFDRIIQSAQTNQSKPAIIIADIFYSYELLLQKAYALSRQFLHYHGENKICVILSRKSIGLYVGMLACFYSNLIYAPLNVDSAIEKNKKILSMMKSYFIFVDDMDVDALFNLLDSVSGATILFLNKSLYILAWNRSTNNALYWIDSTLHLSNQYYCDLSFFASNHIDDTAYLFFTSGSTGTPKAVPISYGNLSVYVQDCASVFSFSSQDRFIQLSDIAFDISIHEIIMSLSVGGTLYVYDERVESNISAFLCKNDITQLVVVPSLIPFLMQQSQFYHCLFNVIKCVLVCGESFPLSFAKMLESMMPNAMIVNLYGPTEATVVCSYHIYQANNDYQSLHTVPIGKPFPRTIFETTETGELIIVGEQVSSGYWFGNNKKSTPFFYDAKKGAMCYHTGDHVSYHDQLGYIFHGRFDDQWQIGGYRVEKNEIESVLRDVITVPDICVVAKKDSANRVIHLIAFSTQPIDISFYKNRLSAFLPASAIPIFVHQLKEIPKLSNGKINYHQLNAEISI